MKRKFKFLRFWLLLVLPAVFSSCSKDNDSKHDPLTFDNGVVINGVKWATRNVNTPGTFVANPEYCGMFYQWNRKKAWAITGGDMTDWDAIIPEGDVWAKANDPSPAGWRVPNDAEIRKLLDTDKVNNERVARFGMIGRKFTDKATGKSIFLPATGYCCDSHSFFFPLGGSTIHYWSSTAHESDETKTSAYGLYFYSEVESRNLSGCVPGFNIRSVAE